MRLLVHTRRIIGVMLPLGTGIGFCVAMALGGLEHFEPWVAGLGSKTHTVVLLPALGLVLATLWLHFTGIGEVSLFKDLDLARTDPYKVFPFWPSLGKVVGCVLTIGFGGSAGIEGPGKWFGAALGLQYHRVVRVAAHRFGLLRKLLVSPMVMVRSGAAASLAAVFRAPLSGALMAAEHHGRMSAESLLPCLVSAATGYVVFAACVGTRPLLPTAKPYIQGGAEIGWALLLGLTCGLGASLFLWVRTRLGSGLRGMHLPLRGLLAGIGLTLLVLPGHLLWEGLPVIEGGGLELVRHLLQGGTAPRVAILFFSLKLVGTALTFAGGGIGGIWLPSVTMGAALGTIFDGLLGLGQPGYMALVGASAFAGATHDTLLIPCVFLAETTGQAALVVPALVGTAVAYLVVQERS